MAYSRDCPVPRRFHLRLTDLGRGDVPPTSATLNRKKNLLLRKHRERGWEAQLVNVLAPAPLLRDLPKRTPPRGEADQGHKVYADQIEIKLRSLHFRPALPIS